MTQTRPWPLPPSGGVTLHHVSDTHWGYRAWSHAEGDHLLRDLNEGLIRPADAFVITGDIVDGLNLPVEDMYAKSWMTAAARGAPSLWCVGNHDLRDRTPNTRAAWEAVYGRPGNTFVDVGDLRIVTFTVNSHVTNTPWVVPEATWSWMDSVIAAHNGPVILANHFPPQELGGLVALDQLQPPARVAELISDHPNVQGMLAGHTHWPADDPRSAAFIEIGNRAHFPVLTDISAMLTLPGGLSRSQSAQVQSVSTYVTVLEDMWEIRYRHHGTHAWSGPGGFRVVRLNLNTGVESRCM